MSLFKFEMEKIWNPLIVTIIFCFGIIYYILFSSFNIIHFINGGEATADFQLACEWTEVYGNTLEKEEIKEIEETYLVKEIEMFEKFLNNFELSKTNGITSYEKFMSFREDYYNNQNGEANPEKEKIIWSIINNSNYFWIQSIKWHIEKFENLYESTLFDSHTVSSLSTLEINRISEINNSPYKYGYLPQGVMDSTFNYIKTLSIWIVLSVVLLLSPTIVRDRLNKLKSLQWTSKKGRKILTVQTKASLLSALILTLINCIIYSALLNLTGVFKLGDFHLNNYILPWVDWTYSQYIVIVFAMMVVLGLATGGLTVFLSNFSNNYIGMLLKAIPLFSILAFISALFLLNEPFILFNKLTSLIQVVYIEIYLLILLLALAIGLCILAIKLQKESDFLEN